MAVYTLYRLYDQDNILLYVGRSSSAMVRIMSAHRNEKPWFKDSLYATFEHFDSLQDSIAAETHAIATENPKYNIAGVKNPQTGLRSLSAEEYWWTKYSDVKEDSSIWRAESGPRVWIKQQVEAYKNGELTDDKTEALEAIRGWYWFLSCNNREDYFVDRIAAAFELVAFLDDKVDWEHGIITDSIAARWITMFQKYHYSLEPEIISVLESTDWQWDDSIAVKTSYKPVPDDFSVGFTCDEIYPDPPCINSY